MQSKGEIVIYKGEDGSQQLEVRLEEDTVWLSQKQIAAVFGTEVPAINKHIKNILRNGELKPKATISKMETVRTEGKRAVTRVIDVYNLDMIISVGYRVNSQRATRFRIWATNVLKNHLVKGYTLNEKRLKQVVQNMQQLEQAIKLIQQSGNSEQFIQRAKKGYPILMIRNYDQAGDNLIRN